MKMDGGFPLFLGKSLKCLVSPEALLLVLGEDLPGDVAHRGDHALADTRHADQSQHSILLLIHKLANHSPVLSFFLVTYEDFSYIMMCPMLHKCSVFTAWLLQNNFSNSDLFTSNEVSLELSLQHFYCQHNISVLFL